MEVLAPYGSKLNNPDPYGYTCRQTMVFFKCTKNMEGSVDDIYATLCGVLFKEEYGSNPQQSLTYSLKKLYGMNLK